MQLKIEETFCFTGHRPNKLYGYDKHNARNFLIRQALKDAIKLLYMEYGIRNFISGMALGTDQWAAEIVLELKEIYPVLFKDIKLIAAIPCRDHSSQWPQTSRDEYNSILDKADYRVMVNKMRYFPQCMQIRNEWMVDKSIGQIAVWDGTVGGTGNCIRYAETKGKTKRIAINPKTFNVQVSM